MGKTITVVFRVPDSHELADMSTRDFEYHLYESGYLQVGAGTLDRPAGVVVVDDADYD